jgi:putative endonuclease
VLLTKLMWYCYILESLKNKILYKGHTDNLKRRFKEHNEKRGGKYTKKFAPFKLIYYETYIEKADAEQTERFYKTGYGREILKGKIKNYLK